MQIQDDYLRQVIDRLEDRAHEAAMKQYEMAAVVDGLLRQVESLSKQLHKASEQCVRMILLRTGNCNMKDL